MMHLLICFHLLPTVPFLAYPRRRLHSRWWDRLRGHGLLPQLNAHFARSDYPTGVLSSRDNTIFYLYREYNQYSHYKTCKELLYAV